MRPLGIFLTGLALASQPGLADAQGETKIHEEGRCAIRGHCGKQSIFGGELPCPDNGLAEEPETPVRQKLVNLCGPKWETGPLCCLEEQVSRYFLFRSCLFSFFFFSPQIIVLLF